MSCQNTFVPFVYVVWYHASISSPMCDDCPMQYAHASLPTIKSLTSLYALSKSSFTTILSCGASGLFANSISTLAWFSLFRIASSLSVALLLSLCSRTSGEGGDRKRKRGRGNVGWFATCFTPYSIVSTLSYALIGCFKALYLHLNI